MASIQSSNKHVILKKSTVNRTWDLDITVILELQQNLVSQVLERTGGGGRWLCAPAGLWTQEVILIPAANFEVWSTFQASSAWIQNQIFQQMWRFCERRGPRAESAEIAFYSYPKSTFGWNRWIDQGSRSRRFSHATASVNKFAPRLQDRKTSGEFPIIWSSAHQDCQPKPPFFGHLYAFIQS